MEMLVYILESSLLKEICLFVAQRIFPVAAQM